MNGAAITVLVSIASAVLAATVTLALAGFAAARAWGRNETAVSALRTEVAEMRVTASNTLARVGKCENKIGILEAAPAIARRARRDLLDVSTGVPTAVGEDDRT